MRLTPDQEAIVQRALARGVAGSPEEVVTAALRVIELDDERPVHERLGMSSDQLNDELRKGLEGPFTEWEGAESFNQRMREKYQAELRDRSSK